MPSSKSSSDAHSSFAAWLEQLSSAAPAPGGGAAAAYSAAMAASLICMVCNLSLGKKKFAAHADLLNATLTAAAKARETACQLADADVEAFSKVITAYSMPRSNTEEQSAREQAIQEALVAAAEVPLHVAKLATTLIDYAEALLGGSNPNVVSDIAVAAASAKAALDAAIVNIDVNLALITDSDLSRSIRAQQAPLLHAGEKASDLVAQVRQQIAR